MRWTNVILGAAASAALAIQITQLQAQIDDAGAQVDLREMAEAARQNLLNLDSIIPKLDARLDTLYDLRDATDNPRRELSLDQAIDRLNLTIGEMEKMRATLQRSLETLELISDEIESTDAPDDPTDEAKE